MVQHPTYIENLTTSYSFTTIMQVYCPVASSTVALSLFSWLSLPACNQQQNHLFIASVRLHVFTAQNPLQGLPAILGTQPKVLTRAWTAYRMEPASFSHLCPSMFLPQSLCTWCLFCLECPSATNPPDFFHHFFSGLWPQSLYLRGLSSLNRHPFVTLYFLALLPFSSHVYYLALYHVLTFYVFAVCGIPVCVTLLVAPLLHIIPPGPRAAAAAAAHDVCWMYEFNPGPFFIQYFSWTVAESLKKKTKTKHILNIFHVLKWQWDDSALDNPQKHVNLAFFVWRCFLKSDQLYSHIETLLSNWLRAPTIS